MRSFSPRTLALASVFLAVPLAGAYASPNGGGAVDEGTPTAFHGPRVSGILGQVRGVHQGIADAEQARQITPAQAHRMEMQAANIDRAAQKIAASDHGRLPSGQYHRLEHRLDTLDQRLMNDTGSGTFMGDGSDGGSYPNG